MKRQWEDERRKLVGENATLKDATSRLNAEVRQAKSDIRRLADTERTKAGTQGVRNCPTLYKQFSIDVDDVQELEHAKFMIEELEEELRAERSRLRALTTEQTKAERQKEEVVLQLRRTESVSMTVSLFFGVSANLQG